MEIYIDFGGENLFFSFSPKASTFSAQCSTTRHFKSISSFRLRILYLAVCVCFFAVQVFVFTLATGNLRSIFSPVECKYSTFFFLLHSHLFNPFVYNTLSQSGAMDPKKPHTA